MDDIICSVAWACDDAECSEQWHQTDYWVYADGTYSVDWYADGDHDDIDASDVPEPDVVNASWLDYARFVKRTGNDPLRNYCVATMKHTPRVFRVVLGPGIAGVVVRKWRTGAQGWSYGARGMHPDLSIYLSVEGNNRFLDRTDIPDLDTLVRLVKESPTNVRRVTRNVKDHSVTLEIMLVMKEPRAEGAVRRDRKKAAAKHIRDDAK